MRYLGQSLNMAAHTITCMWSKEGLAKTSYRHGMVVSCHCHGVETVHSHQAMINVNTSQTNKKNKHDTPPSHTTPRHHISHRITPRLLTYPPSAMTPEVPMMTLFTRDMMANTAESVIKVVSMPACPRLTANSCPCITYVSECVMWCNMPDRTVLTRRL